MRSVPFRVPVPATGRGAAFLRCLLVVVIAAGLSGCLQRSHRLLTKDTSTMPIATGTYDVFSKKDGRWVRDSEAFLRRDRKNRRYRVTLERVDKNGKITTSRYTTRFHDLGHSGLYLVELLRGTSTYYVFPARLAGRRIILINGLNRVVDAALRSAFGLGGKKKSNLTAFSTDRPDLDLAIVKRAIARNRDYFDRPSLQYKRLVRR